MAKSRLSEERSPSRRSWAVTVVPMLAPMMMPTVCSSFMMPALTKPTHITVVAAELWMSPVTRAPSSTPLTTLLVRRSRMLSKRPLESFSRPSVMVDMPNRKVAMAPTRVIRSVIFTCMPPYPGTSPEDLPNINGAQRVCCAFRFNYTGLFSQRKWQEKGFSQVLRFG